METDLIMAACHAEALASLSPDFLQGSSAAAGMTQSPLRATAPPTMENPALSANRLPEQIAGEMIMLSRAGIEFTAKSGAHKFHAHGDLYVTTLRVVFVASRASGSFQAFDLPLATMRSEKFNQPIFGANNLSGTTPPLAGSTGLADDINWKIAFNNGGAGTFLHIFFRLLVEMRQRMAAPAAEMVYEHNVQQNLPQAVVTQVVQAAFVDPSDPTKYLACVKACDQNCPHMAGEDPIRTYIA